MSAASVLVLSALSTAALAVTAKDSPNHSQRAATACSIPQLPGAVVDVRLTDLHSRMGGSMMDGRSLMTQDEWPRFRAGMMSVTATPTIVAAGRVSLRVANTGYLAHELVVLPLAAGQQPGRRVVASEGKVDETGSLGEASASCSAGTGNGIAAGSSGWLTLSLPAGRYELVCNLAGHYLAGMYAELDVP
ncbi:MAG: sulfocyanin-like copper-binding protein [Jatrophihabitantaceae bacterium]